MSAILHMAPGTCARVTAIALETAGVDFETRPIRFMRGEHKSPEFRKLNPLGKVPALEIDGSVLTENLAIITYLAERYPDAGLMPKAVDAAARAKQLADLSFCSATLHPLVTRIRIPNFFAGAENALIVKQTAERAMDEYFEIVEQRLSQGNWWYGSAWSAMDAYLYWVVWRVEGAGYDIARFPHIAGHARKSEELKQVKRALEREETMQAQLLAEGTAFQPPVVN